MLLVANTLKDFVLESSVRFIINIRQKINIKFPLKNYILYLES